LLSAAGSVSIRIEQAGERGAVRGQDPVAGRGGCRSSRRSAQPPRTQAFVLRVRRPAPRPAGGTADRRTPCGDRRRRTRSRLVPDCRTRRRSRPYRLRSSRHVTAVRLSGTESSPASPRDGRRADARRHRCANERVRDTNRFGPMCRVATISRKGPSWLRILPCRVSPGNAPAAVGRSSLSRSSLSLSTGGCHARLRSTTRESGGIWQTRRT
jgi:hypothetical protein